MYKLEITNILCNQKGGDADHDDLMILVQVDAGPSSRFPMFSSHPMEDGDNWSPGSVYYYNNTAYISIWDRDGALNFCDASDLLGTTWVDGTVCTDKEVTVRGDQDASYTITYSITEVNTYSNSNGQNLDSDLLQAISDDLTAWATSSMGQTVIATTDPSDLEDLLKDALVSVAFSKLAEQIKSHEKIQAISLGVMASAEIFGGISGAFGVAINRSDFQFVGIDSDPDDVTSSIFAGAGFVEGVEAGIKGTLAIGIWFEGAGDISGIYVGEEVDVDEGLGITAAAFAGRDDKEDFTDEEGNVIMSKAKVVFAGIDVGVSDGTEAEELYFYAGTMSSMPVSQSGDYDHIAVLDDLHCHDALSQDDGEGESRDHVYIEYTVDDDDTVYRYPIWNTIQMAENTYDHWYCGNAIKFNNKFSVNLFCGKTGTSGSQFLVNEDPIVYTKEEFQDNTDVDHTFSGNQGMHKINYHLHAKLKD